MICPDLGQIGFGRGRGFSPVVFPTPLLLVWTFRFGGSFLFGAFRVATLTTGVRFGRSLLTAGTPSPSPFDKTNCAVDSDSFLGFAVILSSRSGKAGLWVDFRGSSFDGPNWSRGHFGQTTN